MIKMLTVVCITKPSEMSEMRELLLEQIEQLDDIETLSTRGIVAFLKEMVADGVLDDKDGLNEGLNLCLNIVVLYTKHMKMEIETKKKY